jgi:hypothetical protein
MRIALYGPFLFELAVGLKANQANEVRLFLDAQALPRSLLSEPLLGDSGFVEIGPWITRGSILKPGQSMIVRRLNEYDVVLVTDLGPIFAPYSKVPFVFIPTGWDITTDPFPVRSRSRRERGFADLSALAVAYRQRSGIRSTVSIWAPPFSVIRRAVERLGCSLGGWLPQAIDTDLFSPSTEVSVFNGAATTTSLKIFHPTRMMITPSSFLVESGNWKRNDLLFTGFAKALSRGLDARMILLERANSPDQEKVKGLICDLGISANVEWHNSEEPTGFTWLELSRLYKSADVVADQFSSWFGLCAIESASSALPVLNYLEPEAVRIMYPGGHPFVQTGTTDEVCNALLMLNDASHRRSIGRASRRWVLRYHDRYVVARRCETMLAALGIS